MIFKLATKELFTDDGSFIKKLNCPYLVKWQHIAKIDGTRDKTCDICQKTIVDTKAMNDQQVVDLMSGDPEACLKVSPNQKNIKVVNIYD